MKKKTIILITAMVLALAIVTGSTLAYLTSVANKVTNTFVSGGFGVLSLREVDDDGDKNIAWFTGTKTGDNYTNYYNVVPGVDINKNPQVKFEFDADSVATGAYVFVKIAYTPSTANGWKFDEASTTRKLLGYVNGKQALTITLNDGWYVMQATDDAKGELILSIATTKNAVTSVSKGGTHAILTGASVFKNFGTAAAPATIDVSDTLTEADIDILLQNQGSYNLTFSAYAVQKDGLEAGPAWEQVKNK